MATKYWEYMMKFIYLIISANNISGKIYNFKSIICAHCKLTQGSKRKAVISGLVAGNFNRLNLFPKFLKFSRFFPFINRTAAN